MSLKNDLLYQIAKDLKIEKFRGEEQDEYTNRLVYSAIGCWLIHSLQDKDFMDNYNKKGISKSYLTRKISKVVSEYVDIFPSFRTFLDGLSETDFVVSLRENFERAGYIVHAGFDEYILTSPQKVAKLSNNCFLLRNDFENTNFKTIGLASFAKDSNNSEVCNLDELFYLIKMDALNWTKKYIESLRWSNAEKLSDETQFFNAKSIKNFSECWESIFPEDNEITLYKTNDWDYGFVKNTNAGKVGIKIPEWLIGQGTNESEKLFDNDVRRFMYGLKAMNNNRVKVLTFKKTECVEIKLFNALPTREGTVLQFLGWKKRSYLNDYNYIIPNEMVDTMRKLLEHLSIIMEVK
jgi:hypothetical protein